MLTSRPSDLLDHVCVGGVIMMPPTQIVDCTSPPAYVRSLSTGN